MPIFSLFMDNIKKMNLSEELWGGRVQRWVLLNLMQTYFSVLFIHLQALRTVTPAPDDRKSCMYWTYCVQNCTGAGLDIAFCLDFLMTQWEVTVIITVSELRALGFWTALPRVLQFVSTTMLVNTQIFLTSYYTLTYQKMLHQPLPIIPFSTIWKVPIHSWMKIFFLFLHKTAQWYTLNYTLLFSYSLRHNIFRKNIY